jgi:hypothetical protein
MLALPETISSTIVLMPATSSTTNYGSYIRCSPILFLHISQIPSIYVSSNVALSGWLIYILTLSGAALVHVEMRPEELGFDLQHKQQCDYISNTEQQQQFVHIIHKT